MRPILIGIFSLTVSAVVFAAPLVFDPSTVEVAGAARLAANTDCPSVDESTMDEDDMQMPEDMPARCSPSTSPDRQTADPVNDQPAPIQPQPGDAGPQPSVTTQLPAASGHGPVATGRPCPSWVHDQYVTAGPDGKPYPTWHPPIDPSTGCLFGHEHGADPRTSKANPTLPPFGYVSAQMGMTEPHAGFKVVVANAGDSDLSPGQETPRIPQSDYRFVFHMGTSGIKRYTEQFHSVVYDFVAHDGSGRFAHVSGMADTGPTAQNGSQCDNGGNGNGGKLFSQVGCMDSAYEDWSFEFNVIHPSDPYVASDKVRFHISGAIAANDPVLTRDPHDNSRVVYTQTYRGDPRANGGKKDLDPLSPDAYWLGCRRDAYLGPLMWTNAGRETVYYTDALGRVQGGPGPALIKQEISAIDSHGLSMYAQIRNFCGNGIHAPN